MNKLKNLLNTKIIIVLVVVLVIAIITGVGSSRAKKNEDRVKAELEAKKQEKIEQEQAEANSNDSMLMDMQGELVKEFGKLPEGFVWDVDGSLLSLGDKEMTSEDVLYAYFRGLSSLDMSTVERYSRDSLVLDTYNGYFDEKDKNTDYMDQFIRDMYRQCLLSIQIKGIENQSVFAENKKVYNVNASMLDLTDKDFWRSDQNEIFKNLYLYNSDETDSAKSDMYLYDYILKYYKSGEASLRDVTFDITVQKYPDLDSGWLVSIDRDVDNACQYRDGKLVVSYIKDVYINYGMDYVKEEIMGKSE